MNIYDKDENMGNIDVKGIVETIIMHLWELVQKQNSSVKDRGSSGIVAETVGHSEISSPYFWTHNYTIFLNLP